MEMKTSHFIPVLFLSFLLLSPSLADRGGGDDDDDDDGGSPATPTSSTPCPPLKLSSPFPFSTTNFSCNSAWSSQSFTLMYQQTGPSLWSFILTAPDNNAYISVGFSPNGRMVGASAIAGWIPSSGGGVVKQYYLGGTSSGSCPPDKGSLKVVPGSMAIVRQSSTLYLGFQLSAVQPETKLVYAVGPSGSLPGPDNLLPQHQAKVSTTIDYSTGQNSQSNSPPTDSPVSGNSKLATCAGKLGGASTLIPFDTTGFSCYSAWSSYDFILLYKQNSPSLWSFVLSAPDNNAYISVAFSRNGRMVKSSAIAGWKPASGAGFAKQYYLGGTDSGSCPPDSGDLQLVPNKTLIVSQSSRLYLAFQLSTTSQPPSNLLYAIGPQAQLPGSDNLLATHRDMVTTTINYATGESSTTSSATETLKRAHGLLAVFGWGVLIPIGVIVARYFKHMDPCWFYSHITIQGVGFVLGLACLLTGFSLEDKVGVDVDTHKGLGVFILVLGCLQVMAFLIRPNKTAKIRRYWNWYHHYVGRIAIILAIANIFYGISLAHEDNSWKVGYGVFLVIWVITTIGLEIWMRLRRH